MWGLHWLSAELGKDFDNLDLAQGVDLNRDGKIEETECIDRNSDGQFDVAEWKIFLRNNEAQLKALGGIFDNYFEHGRLFDIDNPIHDLLFTESELATDTEINKAYEEAAKLYIDTLVDNKVIDVMESAVTFFSSVLGISIPQNAFPFLRLKALYSNIKSRGFQYVERNDIMPTFSTYMANNILDCDSSSFLVEAIEYELGDPVYVVELPTHAFVRWDDGRSVRFNMDEGISMPDEMYVIEMNRWPFVLSKGVYLKNFEYDELLSFFYLNAAQIYGTILENGKAEDFLNKALALNEKFVGAWYERANTRYSQGRYNEALHDINVALYYNPIASDSHFLSAMIHYSLGHYEESKADLNPALVRNPLPIGYFLLGVVNEELNLEEEALAAFAKASQLNPDLARAVDLAGALYLQGVSDGKNGNLWDAIAYLSDAILHSSDFARPYLMRAAAFIDLEYYDKARADLGRAAAIDLVETATFVGWLHNR